MIFATVRLHPLDRIIARAMGEAGMALDQVGEMIRSGELPTVRFRGRWRTVALVRSVHPRVVTARCIALAARSPYHMKRPEIQAIRAVTAFVPADRRGTLTPEMSEGPREANLASLLVPSVRLGEPPDNVMILRPVPYPVNPGTMNFCAAGGFSR